MMSKYSSRHFVVALAIKASLGRRCKVLVLLLSLGVFVFPLAAQAPKNKAGASSIPTVSVEAYRADLKGAISQLKRIESRPPRRIRPVLQRLAKTERVQRRDGETQIARGDEWSRRAQSASSSASRREVEATRHALEVRLRALDEWSTSAYAPADAQAIVRQLAGSGQIRTGPTWWQQRMADYRNWLRTSWTNFLKWMSGLFPAASPAQSPKIDLRWIQGFFYLSVFALLFVLAFLVWRAVGGRLGRRSTRRRVLAEGEDAELLLLPPDELRERARRFAEAGDFREALRHLYISLLLTLDARGVWRYDARRTNWEHIRALRSDVSRANLIAPLSNVTRVFDRVRYGNADFLGDDWTRFENEVQHVESQTLTS
jgi:hypothetical protein